MARCLCVVQRAYKMRGNCVMKVVNNWIIADTSNCKLIHSCFIGPVGQQQLIVIFWRVIGGGVAPTAGPGEVWAGSSPQRLGRPRVPQVQPHTDRHAFNGVNQLTRRPCCDLSQFFSSDITEEDLEEAGVLDPAHKHILLESLKQQQK